MLAPQASGLLPVQFHLSVREHPADVNHSATAVDVAPLERQPLGTAQARQAGEDRNGSEGGGELVRDRLQLCD